MSQDNIPTTTPCGSKPTPTVSIPERLRDQPGLDVSINSLHERMMHELLAYQESQMMKFLGAKNYEQALEIIKELRELGLVPRVKETDLKLNVSETDDKFTARYESTMTFTLVEIDTGAEVTT